MDYFKIKADDAVKCANCNYRIDPAISNKIVEDLLNKYGPEGCMELSEMLKLAAWKDMNDAISQV